MGSAVAADVLEHDLFEELAPVIEGLGYQIVELRAKETKHGLQLTLVIYREGGVSLDDCALVHETIQPRIEVSRGARDVRLEVSSPGTERVIKATHEYRIFAGKGVRVLEHSTGQWILGTIGEVRDDGFTLNQAEATRNVLYSDIKKARLDDSQEVS